MFSSRKSNASFTSLSSTLNEKESTASTRSSKSMLRRMFTIEKSPAAEAQAKLSPLEKLEQLRRTTGHPSVQAYYVR